MTATLEMDVSQWNDRNMLSDLLKQYDLPILADALMDQKRPLDLKIAIDLLEKIARQLNDTAVLDQLHFAGLIY